ncbi:MAG: hypothetical protein K1X53_00555 [Candidatus Sumerlaeaceae bacterium]|nr:hypothetical protein [Candidatus Sumerlaeaceae bacterium]
MNTIIRHFLILMGIVICLDTSVKSSATGATSSNTGNDCTNTNPDCCECQTCCPPGPGGPGGAGGGGGKGGKGGGTTSCFIKCSASNAVSAPIGAQTGNSGYQTAQANPHVGKGIVQLRKGDMTLSGKGDSAISIGRTYNNWTVTDANNTAGNTVFGQLWHFSYDMAIEGCTGGDCDEANMRALRTSAGGQHILYPVSGQETTHWRGRSENGAPVDVVTTTAGFIMTQPDPTIVYSFNLDGKLTRIRTRSGNTVELTRDANNRVTRADFSHENAGLDNDTRYATFHYDTFTTFAYPLYYGEPYVRLTRVTSHDGRSVTYSYTDRGYLEEVRDYFGQVMEKYVYTNYNAETVVSHNGYYPLLSYHYEAGPTTMTLLRHYYYNPDWLLVRIDDGFGNLLARLNLEEDAEYYKKSITFEDGRKIWYKLNVSRDPLETRMYDTTGTLYSTSHQTFLQAGEQYVGETMRDSVSPKTIVNEAGTTTTYGYVNEGVTTAPEWTKMLLAATVAPDGTRTEYEYDANYHVTAIKRPLSRTTRYGYDAEGNRLWTRDAAGNYWYTTYNAYGQVTKTEDPTSGTMLTGYNTDGSVSVTTDSEGRATTYAYDSYSRLISTTRLGLTSTNEYNAADYLTTVTDTSGGKTVYEYDGMGRKIAQTDPLGNRTQYVYDENWNLRNVIDADGKWTTSTIDKWGHLLKWTDQRGNSTEYTYDLLGRLVSEKNPLNQVTSYSYDNGSGCGGCGGSGGSGRLASKTDPASRTTYYTYDIMGRITTMTYSGVSDQVVFGFDAAGRRTSMTDNRLPLSDLGGQTFSWTYDIMDRVASEVYPGGATTNTVGWTYNSLGRRTSMTDPDGNVTAYYYYNTSTNRKLYSIQHSQMGETYYSYRDSDGLLDFEDYPNYMRNYYEYDAAKRVSALGGQHTILYEDLTREEYTYNAASMRTRIDFNPAREGFDPYHKLYKYDPVLRLTEEHKRRSDNNASMYRYAYTYDEAGNRTQMVHYDGSSTETTAYAYNPGNQLADTVVNDVDWGWFTFDSNGNLEWDENPETYVHYYHNRENRLYQVHGDSFGAVGYVYDASGRLLMRTDPDGNKTRYYYDGLGWVLIKEKPNGGSAWRTKNVYALKQASLGHIISERINTSWNGSGLPTGWSDKWFHYDLLGNVTAETADGGNSVAIVDMEAFGSVNSGGSNGFRFETKSSDAAMGLYIFPARNYESNLGCFLEHAPYSPHIEHPYAFGKDNPMSYVDPMGENPYVLWKLLRWVLTHPECIDAMGQAAALAQEVHKGSIHDKWGHCVAHCEITKGCGQMASEIISGGKELYDQIKYLLGLGRGREGWDALDIAANDQGQECGKCDGKSCMDCCSQHFSVTRPEKKR